MRWTFFFAVLWAMAFATWPCATGQETREDAVDHPGFFPLDELEILDPEHLSLEINLHAPMLRVVAVATRRSDPEFSALVANLVSVRVRTAPLDEVDPEKVRAGIVRAGRWLRERGWQTIVRSRDDGEQIHVYLRQVDDEIVGVAVLAINGGTEATALNIVGPIDLAQLVKLGERFDIGLLGELDVGEGSKRAPPRKKEEE